MVDGSGAGFRNKDHLGPVVCTCAGKLLHGRPNGVNNAGDTDRGTVSPAGAGLIDRSCLYICARTDAPSHTRQLMGTNRSCHAPSDVVSTFTMTTGVWTEKFSSISDELRAEGSFQSTLRDDDDFSHVLVTGVIYRQWQ
ncbi:hypothetical protein Bbelb_103690 [Branchiostoma belcheri]|nr:hypothetical protein Bbelb_103690 [Branchiostoma belcheri]